jgi:Ca-activated chloride channel family protein
MSTTYLDNYYARLGISKTATLDEILQGYRRAARRYHPDTNKKTGANELFLQVQEAFDTLSEPERRREYDASLPADIDPPKAVMVNTLYSRGYITPGEAKQVVYVLLDLMAAQNEEERRAAKPGLNVSLVLDTSTSMSGDRLNKVIKAASQLISQLEEQDVLSVVAFNDRGEVIIPGERGQDKARLAARIATLQTRGGTEMLSGLVMGLKEVQRNARPNSINHIVLITDGRTYGDEDACFQLAQDAGSHGVPISAIGIGTEWNEDFIDKLAALAGGSSIFVDRSADIHKLLETQLKSLNQVYANNVKLNYQAGANARLNYAFRLPPEAGAVVTESPLFLGTIPAQNSLSILLEFEVDAGHVKEGDLTLAEGELSMDIPTRAIPSTKARFRLSRSVRLIEKPDVPPQALVNAIGKLSLYRMQERAREELEAGDTQGAAKRMRMLATHLLSLGERSLARTVLLAADELKDDGALGEESGKQIKYGTRALVGSVDAVEKKKRSKR